MSSFGTLIVERGAATVEQLELAFGDMLRDGGDLGTSLVRAGVLKENTLHRLLSEYHELPVGPHGELGGLDEPLREILPPAWAVQLRVYPVKRTRRTLHLAVAEPLDPDVEQELRAAVKLRLRAVVVPRFRLMEALWRHCGLEPSAPDRRLLELLAAGLKPTPAPVGRPAQQEPPRLPPYRRMAEAAGRVVPSDKQPEPRGVAPQEPPSAASVMPDTLEGVGPKPQPGAPSALAAAQPAEPSPVSEPAESKPTTDRWMLDESDGAKRDTQPWRDDERADEPPVSMRREFHAHLSEAPPSDEAKIHEDHREFRHRGPFTRAQAELAVGHAPEVETVLEVLVRYARQFFERSVLFVVKGSTAELRLSSGLAASLASLALPLGEPGVLAQAFERGGPVIEPLADAGADRLLREALGVGVHSVAVVPLRIRERVVALFYGDDRADGVDRDAVADVHDFTAICAHRITALLIARKRTES